MTRTTKLPLGGGLGRRLIALGGGFAWAVAAAAAPGTPYLTVHAETVAVPIETYAQVQPIAIVPVKTPAAGIVAELALLPGSAVQAGDTLAKLTGPEISGTTARAEAAVKSATARLAAANKTLAIVRPQLAAHLSTAQQVAQAEADVADAAGALATAQAELQTITAAATITAPVAGTILAFTAAAGERLAAGDTLLTLQPSADLWATGALFGLDASAVHDGSHGTFTPSSGGAPTAVKVVSVAPTTGTTGEVTIGMRAAQPNPAWRTGDYGTVILEGAPERFVAVPTAAVILDQAKWWVLVHTTEGDKPVAVVPGPTRGWQTLLRSGVAPGTQIVAQNAYLEYHRQIASRYQPPD